MNTSEIPNDSIVVAVDGSEHASRAVAWAARQASLERRPLSIVQVGEDGTASDVVKEAAVLAHETCPEIDVHAVSVTGEPSDVLVALSADAHLVVMGSHGRGGLRTRLLGSVSAAVAKHAACPVAVSRPSNEPFAKLAIVVGADGTPESLPVIEFAFRQASLRGMPLHIVHVYKDPRATAWRNRTVPTDKLRLHAQISGFVAGIAERYPDVHVTIRLEDGAIDESIERGLRPYELVVVGRRPTHQSHRFGEDSVATSVLERSQSTVVVVPEASSPESETPADTAPRATV